MRTAPVQSVEMLLKAAITLVAVHLSLILYLDGYALSLHFATFQAQGVAPPTIALLLLILLRFILRDWSITTSLFSTNGAAMLFCVFLILYLANGATKTPGDAIPARYLPLSILREGNLDLNEFSFLYAQEIPYYLREVKGRYVSTYPVGPAIAAVPFYLVSAIGRVAPNSELLADLEKLAAASFVALSAGILYLLLRRLSSQRYSVFITMCYALGSSSLSASSQGLWQHGPSQLTLTTAMYGLVRGRHEPIWIPVAGFSLAFALICRPTNFLIALPLTVYVGLYHRAYIGRFLFGGLPPGLFQLWYNATYFGDWLFMPYPLSYWSTQPWEGLSGILISPSRGLFVYSPIFLGTCVGMALAWCRHGDPLLRTLSIGIVSTLVLYGHWSNWWGGFSYGPRLLADLTPALSICLVPVKGCLERNRCLRWTFLGLMLWSIWAHGLGAFEDDGRWNASPLIDLSPHRNWSVSAGPLVEYSRDVLRRAWILIRQLPTSRSAPELLSATYQFDPSGFETIELSSASPCPLRLCLTAVNTGQAIWLSAAKQGMGSVKLAWRWLKDGKEVLGFSGLEPLRHDVFPGHSYEFQLAILPMPPTAGLYVLEVGMLSVSKGQFADQGVAPVRIPVMVPVWTPEILHQYLSTPLVVSAESPSLSISIDRPRYRPGDNLRVSIGLTVTEKPVLIDAYLALHRPDGYIDFFSGDQLVRSAGDPIPMASRVYIHKRSHFSSAISLRLEEELPPGAYAIDVFITEATSYRRLAKARARFRAEL